MPPAWNAPVNTRWQALHCEGGRSKEIIFDARAETSGHDGQGRVGDSGWPQGGSGAHSGSLGDLKVGLDVMQTRLDALRTEGQTAMLVAVDDGLAGIIGVADSIRASTPEAIRLLHEDGLKIIMLTGDNRTTAEAVARRLGIDQVIADVLPEQKPSGETPSSRRACCCHGG